MVLGSGNSAEIIITYDKGRGHRGHYTDTVELLDELKVSVTDCIVLPILSLRNIFFLPR